MSLLLIHARVDWQNLAGVPGIDLTRGGCDQATFESISDCLRTGQLEDVSRPQTPDSHHPARIASLVRLLEAGAQVDPMVLNVLPSDGERLSIWFEDGSHRFRAYEYLDVVARLPVILRGELTLIRRAFALAGCALT